MIPPLVRLPATVLTDGSVDELAGLVASVGADRTVLVGDQLDRSGDPLDAFVIAAAAAARVAHGHLGVATRVGAGRLASIIAREATALQLLGGCEVLVLEGLPAACRDAATVIEALFTPGPHTVTTPTTSIVAARNLPLPSVLGGPPVCWREGAALVRLDGTASSACGRVVEVDGRAPLPAPEPGVLLVVAARSETPRSLAAALAP